ncbi:primosomal protein [Vibrio sp. vnigr-6D03]|uniref:pleiotropic regulatory protein RsmS n=1 Tax=Vibrio sp. vnigr-6D03 TaxID=2058088 RepID=UPI000C347231|nr:pleiotropic regulatory protein RsmS [Vibrio sp. vnigr-6D03]PKF79473.1 primosomal protein [Vibrio sp. vnigr-6D03]
MTHSNSSSPLDTAPDEIKLAVDLIYLLESNEVDIETALAALEIVKSDLQKKRLTKEN